MLQWRERLVRIVVALTFVGWVGAAGSMIGFCLGGLLGKRLFGTLGGHGLGDLGYLFAGALLGVLAGLAVGVTGFARGTARLRQQLVWSAGLAAAGIAGATLVLTRVFPGLW